MASILSCRHPPTLFTISHHVKPHHQLTYSTPRTHFCYLPIVKKLQSFNSSTHSKSHLGLPKIIFRKSSATSSSDSNLIELVVEKDESLLSGSDEKPVKFFLWVLFCASVSIGLYAFSGSGDAKAAAAAIVAGSGGASDSIRASGFGVKVANAMRSFGWADEAVVFALATLPVIELRGAIPVGYWLQLKPVILTVLSVLGNMVPVPLIILYLKKVASFLASKNQAASRILDILFERAKQKAVPVKEFQWLGLMLFVAVPFPGTGAWTGAIIASILDMPFWSAVSANFVGVVIAGLLVNLLVNLGLKYAIVTGVILFVASTFMWSILRSVKRSLPSSS